MDCCESTKKEKQEILVDLEASEEQIAQGKTREAKEALQSVKRKHGLTVHP